MASNRTPSILKIAATLLICIISAWYIKHFYFDTLHTLSWPKHINYTFLFFSICALAMPHICRIIACIHLLRIPKKNMLHMCAALSLQYFLIFLFPFKIGELSLVHLFHRRFNMSWKRSLCIMMIIQFLETASCAIFILISLFYAGSDILDNTAISILKKAIISGLFTFSILLIAAYAIQKYTALYKRFSFLTEIKDVLVPRSLIRYFFTMSLGWGCAFFCPIFIFRAIGSSLPYYKSVIGASVAYAGCESIIKPPFGIGLFHIGWVETLSILGVSGDLCHITGIIAYITLLTIVLSAGITGFFILFRAHMSDLKEFFNVSSG